jgi:hypothetical protein
MSGTYSFSDAECLFHVSSDRYCTHCAFRQSLAIKPNVPHVLETEHAVRVDPDTVLAAGTGATCTAPIGPHGIGSNPLASSAYGSQEVDP